MRGASPKAETLMTGHTQQGGGSCDAGNNPLWYRKGEMLERRGLDARDGGCKGTCEPGSIPALHMVLQSTDLEETQVDC